MSPEVVAAFHEKSFQTPVIGVTGGKGGVGKTTVAVNLACALAARGHKVALADADVDAPNAAILLGLSLDDRLDVAIAQPVVDHAHCTSCGACVSACRMNALFLPKGKIPLLLGACNGCEACILVCKAGAISRGRKVIGTTYKTVRGNLTLYAGELLPTLEGSAVVVGQLKERVFKEAAGFDIILVDTSPGAHCNVVKALQGADSVIAVTEPTPFGAHDFELILNLLDIFALKGKAFLNRADLPSPKDPILSIAREHDVPVVAELVTDDLLITSYVAGTPLVEAFPETAGAIVFFGLADAIAREYVR